MSDVVVSACITAGAALTVLIATVRSTTNRLREQLEHQRRLEQAADTMAVVDAAHAAFNREVSISRSVLGSLSWLRSAAGDDRLMAREQMTNVELELRANASPLLDVQARLELRLRGHELMRHVDHFVGAHDLLLQALALVHPPHAGDPVRDWARAHVEALRVNNAMEASRNEFRKRAYRLLGATDLVRLEPEPVWQRMQHETLP